MINLTDKIKNSICEETCNLVCKAYHDRITYIIDRDICDHVYDISNENGRWRIISLIRKILSNEKYN